MLVSPRVPPAWNTLLPSKVMVGPPWQGPIETAVAHRPTMRLAGTGSAPVGGGLGWLAMAGAANRASETASILRCMFMGNLRHGGCDDAIAVHPGRWRRLAGKSCEIR